MTIGTGLIVRAGGWSPTDFYYKNALYAVWDRHNRIIGKYVGHNAGYGLPEFIPLIWEGEDAEPLRHVCAGPKAWVRNLSASPR